MAALSMGNFGAYKFAYSKYLQEREMQERAKLRPEAETVWVTKRYDPTDVRAVAPVPRYKPLAPKELPPADPHWVPTMEPPLKSFDRGVTMIYESHPASRCEEWSTLRQMLPSRGGFAKTCPPNWGTSYSLPPIFTDRPGKRFPNVNSPMTRYVDDMHLTNRLFKLH